MNTTVTIKSREDAQLKFRKLVESFRTRAIWFLNPAQPVDMISSSSIGVLDCIAKKCSQADWIETKKLRLWLLHRISNSYFRRLSERRKREGVSYIAGGAALNDALKAADKCV
jgi:hypothetical protein